MTPPSRLGRRGWRAVRQSMTAQISLSITLVSVLVIALLGSMVDQYVRSELREENEVLLLANLAFLRDDFAATGFDAARAPELLARAERRVHRLHAALVDERTGGFVARSPLFPVPADQLPTQAFDAARLPAGLDAVQAPGLPARADLPTTIFEAPDGVRYRVLAGRFAAPTGAMRLVTAIETSNTLKLRSHNRRDLVLAMTLAGVLAAAFGVWIARRILANARRLGSTASRISAHALGERLPLEQTPTELAESTIAFNHMLDRLQSGFERLSAFSSDLAHDLRTPIGNLMGEAQVALSRPRSNEEYRAVLESAVEEYERLSRMIANMLFLARADNDQATVCAQWIGVDEAFDRVIGYFELLADERGVFLAKLVRAPATDHRRLWGDETMVVRALSNLVSNALRHASRGSTVTLSATMAAGGGCIIEVANEGAAIDAAHHEHIFGRFYRVDAARRGSASGSGLGLAIVRSIMELHGGKASVASGPDRPTVFTLSFPAPQA